MVRQTQDHQLVRSLDLTDCPTGAVLDPLVPRSEAEQRCFGDWEAPLAPWGGFRVDSGLAVEMEEDRPALIFTDNFGGGSRERALVARSLEGRNGRIVAEIKAEAFEAPPHMDRHDCRAALIGVVFRMETSRAYYQLALEGRRRVVLYRRRDDEWFELAVRELSGSDMMSLQGYVALEVVLDDDGIRCRCEALGVDFFCTDTMFRAGKVGVRALGRARLRALSLWQTPAQQARDERRRARHAAARATRGASIPEPELRHTFDLAELGADPVLGGPIFQDFAQPGRYDLLVLGAESVRALTPEGQPLWEQPLKLQAQVVFSKGDVADPDGSTGRLIYGFTGLRESNARPGVRGEVQVQTVADEMVVLRGCDGAVVARAKLPELLPNMRYVDYAPTSGDLTGSGGFDIVLREWRQDKEGGGVHLWAYDRELSPLWRQEVTGAWYGHHHALQFCDVTGDGRDELLAGGTLFDAAGQILWVHDYDAEVQSIRGATHYDAVALGALADDPSVDPVAFLLAGSAGVYVVDGLTGRTRAIHRIGHAQGRFIGRVRTDLPGQQVLAVTRWGNYGILTLFSGHGDRLWSIQPDYIGQGSCPVSWPSGEAQLIWANTSGPVQAFYDGYGQLVKSLPTLGSLWGERMRREVVTRPVRIGKDPWDYLTLTVAGKLYAFGPEA